MNFHHNLFNLNQTFMENITARDRECGFDDIRNKYLTYPPPGPLPSVPDVKTGGNCDIFNDVFSAVSLINPCFDIYQAATTCPLLWDVLGFPGSFDYLPMGAPNIYFNRTDVQKAINAPIEEWNECSSGVLDTDNSPPSGLSVLPGVIEKSKRTVIGHGQLDMILIANGTLLMIQNMTVRFPLSFLALEIKLTCVQWNGKQGFTSPPSQPFYIPYHDDAQMATLAGAGNFGTTHTERGLTWVEVALSGHMIPQYAPSAAYRHLEYLLGRIDSLSEVSPFSTQR